jgi:uncharacterized membrane protein
MIYCKKCGSQNNDNASYCSNCGTVLEHEYKIKKASVNQEPQNIQNNITQNSVIQKQTTSIDQKKTGLIFFGYASLFLETNIFGFGITIEVIFSIIAFLIAIILICSNNPYNKKHGKIILSVWLVANIIGFIISFNNSYNGNIRN